MLEEHVTDQPADPPVSQPHFHRRILCKVLTCYGGGLLVASTVNVLARHQTFCVVPQYQPVTAHAFLPYLAMKGHVQFCVTRQVPLTQSKGETLFSTGLICPDQAS
jgi:hypothetical protein